MQVLYSINKNEDIDIFNKLFCKNDLNNEILKNKFGRFYRTLNSQVEDFYYVKNYDINKILKVNSFDEIVTLQNKGYKVCYDDNVNTQNFILSSKIKDIRHIVKPLQTLNDIAILYGISRNQIISNNNLKSDKLFIGQILYI